MNKIKIESDFTESGTKIFNADTGEEIQAPNLSIEVSNIGYLRTYSVKVRTWVDGKKPDEAQHNP